VNLQSWGKGSRRWSGMVPFERAFVTSYRLSIVTFPLSLRVSKILPLLCSSTPFFPTPPLVSPEVGEWPLGYEERRCWANCPCNYFARFPTYVVRIHLRFRQTYRRTDDMQSQNCAYVAYVASSATVYIEKSTTASRGALCDSTAFLYYLRHMHATTMTPTTMMMKTMQTTTLDAITIIIVSVQCTV